MSAVTFELRRLDQLSRRLDAIQHGVPSRAARALRTVAEVEMTEAKRRTPVDTGNLRATGHVQGPFWSADGWSVKLVFGGPAASYAAAVHENLEAFHRVGQAKYLESVILEVRPHLAQRIARAMRG